MSKPKPILEFYSVPGGRDTTNGVISQSKSEQPPKDLRWVRVEEFFSAKTFAPKTGKVYKRELLRFTDWTNKAWNDINGRDIANYKRYLEELLDSQGKPQLSPPSVGVALTALKSFFKWLVAAYYISENPTVAVSIPPQKKPQPQHLEEHEVDALYDALEYRGEMQLRDTAILAVLEHGLRADEVSQLNLGDYDGQRVYIRQAKHDSTGWVPLSPEAARAVDCYLKERRLKGDKLDAPDAPLFLSHSPKPKLKGQRLGYDGIYKMICDLGELAGVAECHPHRLRHTFATRLVLMGIDSYLARKLTRHESESAFRRYSEHARGVAAEAAYRQAIAKQRSGSSREETTRQESDGTKNWDSFT